MIISFSQRLLLVPLLAVVVVAEVIAAPVITPKIVSYKTVEGKNLTLHVYQPVSNTTGRAAVLFFHGGGWTQGKPDLLFSHCEWLAAQGVVGISASYRLFNHGAAALSDCEADALAALQYVRGHAGELGINPQRIVLAGESAGGQLAAAVVLATNAPAIQGLALFNPVLDLLALPWAAKLPGAVAASPFQHICADRPPTVIIHGIADEVVPIEQAYQFARSMVAAGNRCELVALPGRKHAFFIPGFGHEAGLREGRAELARFLISLGDLPAPTEISFPSRPRLTDLSTVDPNAIHRAT